MDGDLGSALDANSELNAWEQGRDSIVHRIETKECSEFVDRLRHGKWSNLHSTLVGSDRHASTNDVSGNRSEVAIHHILYHGS